MDRIDEVKLLALASQDLGEGEGGSGDGESDGSDDSGESDKELAAKYPK